MPHCTWELDLEFPCRILKLEGPVYVIYCMLSFLHEESEMSGSESSESRARGRCWAVTVFPPAPPPCSLTQLWLPPASLGAKQVDFQPHIPAPACHSFVGFE